MFVELINILDRITYLRKPVDIEPWRKDYCHHSLRTWIGGTGTHNRAWESRVPITLQPQAVARCKISKGKKSKYSKGFLWVSEDEEPRSLNSAHVSKLTLNATTSRTAALTPTQGGEGGDGVWVEIEAQRAVTILTPEVSNCPSWVLLITFCFIFS